MGAYENPRAEPICGTTRIKILSDNTWKSWSGSVMELPADWANIGFDDSGWRNAYAPYPYLEGYPPDNPDTGIPGTEAVFMWDYPDYPPIIPNGQDGPDEAWFRKTFNLPCDPSCVVNATVIIAADDDFDFYVNGKLVYHNDDCTVWTGPFTIEPDDIIRELREGENVFAIYANDCFGAWEWVLVDATIEFEALPPYTFLCVTDYGAWTPSINNNSEIVYVAYDANGYPQVFSTERGQLTYSDTRNLRFTDINDAGEVVYADIATNGPSFNVYSTIRGEDISPPNFQSNAPGINNLGEVSYEHTQTLPRGIYSSERGMVVESTTGFTCILTDINDSGEIVYNNQDANGNIQIYSSTRGQLTTSGGYTATISNYGDVIYTNGTWGGPMYIYSLDGTQITDFPVSVNIDMNDYGDIVLAVQDSWGGWTGGGEDSRIILATRTPERYPQYPPYIPSHLSDVTAMIQVDKFGTRFDRGTGHFSMMTTWTNIGDEQCSEPLQMVIECITPDSVTCVNEDGTTECGKPYYDYSDLVGDGILTAGERSAAKQLIFNNPNRARFEFEVSCWAMVEGGAAPSVKPIDQAQRIQIVIPTVSALAQNYPNPFNPETWIPYELAKDSDVRISIYDVKGRLVRTINLGHHEVGQYFTKDKAAHWDGRNEFGEKVSSGVYFYRIQAGDFHAVRKMVILK
jgi:hypothetical protein